MKKIAKVTYHLTDEDIKAALVAYVEASNSTNFKGKDSVISFDIRERGGDPMDRFPGVPTLVGASVTVSDKEEPTNGMCARGGVYDK